MAIDKKLTTMGEALATLQDGIALHEEFQSLIIGAHTSKDERIAMGLRDSMIQRFEYCTDLFWKVLKLYLEEVQKITLTVNSPAAIIRASVEAKIITEDEGAQCIQMIKNRNLTSHIYHQEVAYDIAKHVPSYYQLMYGILGSISGK